ncbi:MAG: OmpH family outer membrane protein [Ignavibacteriales bacterium]|nr:OmpH family outer membrane protein [Ignavibacteriales bacterium]
MKKYFFFTIILFCISSGNSQTKVGYINLKAIMGRLTEAQDVQRQFDAITQQWQDSLQEMQADWQKKFEDYDKKKLVMTDQTRSEKEKELQDLEKSIMDFRNKKFSPTGELYTKQNELMKPIQNKVFKVLREIADEDNYDYVFDKSGDILLLYSREKYDLTEKVLEKMQKYGK